MHVELLERRRGSRMRTTVMSDRAARDRKTVVVKAMLAAADAAVISAAALTVAGAKLALLAPIVWIAAFGRKGLYRTSNVQRRVDELGRVVSASAMAVLVISLVSPGVQRAILLFTVGTTCVAVEREVARRLFARMRCQGTLRRAVLVVGGNREAADLAAALSLDPTLGFDVLGFVADDPAEHLDPVVREHLLGPVCNTRLVAEAAGATSVVIATTAVSTASANVLVRTLDDAGIHVELSSGLCDIVVPRLSVGGIGRFPTVHVQPVPRSGWRTLAKRAIDITVAVLGLLLTLPLLVATAVAVKLTSRGPVFFRQVRVGKDGTSFRLYKFRTMVVDAETRLSALRERNEASGPLFKMADDPRVTRIGRFLRRTSIDELPQLWNVLHGEMSIVGPRPALPTESESWEPALRERLRVKPGITGMWQVSGRSGTSFDEYARLDLLYVHNWSLQSDMTILAQTVPAVLFGRGAL